MWSIKFGRYATVSFVCDRNIFFSICMDKETMIRRMQTNLCHRSLGTFAKFRKETISFIIFVSLSVRQSAWNNSAPTFSIFIKFDVYVFLKNLSRIQIISSNECNIY
jgi:hypothetical protein